MTSRKGAWTDDLAHVLVYSRWEEVERTVNPAQTKAFFGGKRGFAEMLLTGKTLAIRPLCTLSNEMGGGGPTPPPADPQQFRWFTDPNQPIFFA